MYRADDETLKEFLAASAQGDILQCPQWGELKARTGWEPLQFSIEVEGQIRAAALVLKRPIPRIGRCLFYCPRGPVVAPEHVDALDALVADIRQAARSQRAIALKIDPAITYADTVIVNRLRKLGFKPPSGSGHGFGGTQPRSVMKVDISGTEDDVQARFHAKWRYNIRLAAKKGCVVTIGDTAADMDAFYEVLQVTAQRDGFRVRNRTYFQHMRELIIEPGMGKLFLVKVGDTVVSGAIAFVLGDKCWYVYGASDNEHRNLMPNHLMQWEMMVWARAQGCTIYDMRGVSPEIDGEPTEPHIAGLNRFKKGFGADYIEYIGDWDLVFSPVLYAGFTKLLPLARKALAKQATQEAE